MPEILSPAQVVSTLAAFQKAITTTDFPTGNLNRQDLQAEIVVAAPIETPLRNRLKRAPGNGQAHMFYQLVPNADKSQGIFLGTTPGNAVFANGGLPTFATEDYKQVSIPYYNIGDIAQVTFQDQAQGRSFTDLMAQRKRVKMINVGMIEEYFILNGNSSQVQAGGGYIFDGLISILTNNGGNLIAATNGEMNLGTGRQACRAAWDQGGVIRAMVIDSFGKSVLTAQVAQLYAIRQQDESAMRQIAGGISINAWDFGTGPVDWVVSRYLVPQYGGSLNILFLDDMSLDQKNDGTVIQMVDVDPIHSIDLATVTTASRSLVYETTALMVAAPSFQSMVTGVTYNGQNEITG